MNSSVMSVLVRVARDARVVGGVAAGPGEFPHHVAINYDDNYLCSGSIISTMLVLTAAHCIFSSFLPKPRIYLIQVIAGLHNLTDEGVNEQIRNVKFVYKHDDYNPQTFENDIAIMVLSEPLKYTSRVKNIGLPHQNEHFHGFATVSGWGRTSRVGLGSAQLRKVNVPLVSYCDCKIKYQGFYNITDEMLCMGDGKRDSCQGDSGGAAVCQRRDLSIVQCGIVSFGRGCAQDDIPGVYTRVSSYVAWINQIESKILAEPIVSGRSRNHNYTNFGCIPSTFLCSNVWNCRSHDAGVCSKMISCLNGEFRCNNGRCIRRELTCNDVDDCDDRSDESECPSKRKPYCENGYQCGARGECYSVEERCNGEPWCYDNSDEEECGSLNSTLTADSTKPPCSGDLLRKFYCSKDFICIPLRFWCDGDKDCPSGVDELDCANAEKNKTETRLNPLEIVLSPFTNRIEKSASRMRNDESGCLKMGTKILMADGSERNVEDLKLGDYVLDMNLKPTRIIGVNYQYIRNLKFYGFDNKTLFFTSEHMFVGPMNGDVLDVQFYVVSLQSLLESNPLMKYWNVKEMPQSEESKLFQYNSTSNTFVAKRVGIYQDPSSYPSETPVFFIQVDSPSGTYFANGFVCKVDMPPLQKWPNTMGLLFKVLETSSFETLSKIPYSLESIDLMENITMALTKTVNDSLASTVRKAMKYFGPSAESPALMTLESTGVSKSLHRIFNEPTMAYLSMKLYARTGKVISTILDSKEITLDAMQVAKVQQKLLKMIAQEMDRY